MSEPPPPYSLPGFDLVMEYISGMCLQNLIKQFKRLSLQ